MSAQLYCVISHFFNIYHKYHTLYGVWWGGKDRTESRLFMGYHYPTIITNLLFKFVFVLFTHHWSAIKKVQFQSFQDFFSRFGTKAWSGIKQNPPANGVLSSSLAPPCHIIIPPSQTHTLVRVDRQITLCQELTGRELQFMYFFMNSDPATPKGKVHHPIW